MDDDKTPEEPGRQSGKPGSDKSTKGKKRRPRERPKPDDAAVDEASDQSFPASDPPSYTGTTA